VNLKTTFDAIEVAAVREWITSRRQEDLHLDFKQLRDSPEVTKDDRKNLAKAISGFANSDGGVIAWGVDARPDDTGIDAASGLVPLRSGKSILSKLLALTGQAATPIVDGVEHRLLTLGPDESLVLTLVPTSDGGPHMAGLGERRYYKRSGSAFYVMEHFDIADMFGRRRRPELRLVLSPSVTARNSGPGGRSVELQILVSLHNRGRASGDFRF
jgi:hypothetical protein